MIVSIDYVKPLTNLKIEGGDKMASLKHIVVFEEEIMDKKYRPVIEKALKAGLTITTWQDVINAGKNAENPTVVEPAPDDCFMFSYTSGTTGDPKGVKLTHRMSLSLGYSINTRIISHGSLGSQKDDCYISYLPAAHSFEQGLFAMSVAYKFRIGHYGGNVLKLTEDMGILKPTIFPSVPRLYNRIYGKIKDKFKAKKGILGALVKRAVASKSFYLKDG